MKFTVVKLMEKGLIKKTSVMNSLKKAHYKNWNIYLGVYLILIVISANLKCAWSIHKADPVDFELTISIMNSK